MTKVEFGVRLPVAGVLASTEAIMRAAREADAMGFDTIWVNDFLLWSRELNRSRLAGGSHEAVEAAGEDFPPVFYESLTTLSFCAAITEHVRLGFSVFSLPVRNPLWAAKQISCLDVLSDGRVDLGIGQGAPTSTGHKEFELLGVPRKDKVARSREYFEVMRNLWTQDTATFSGEYIVHGEASMYPKPIQKPYPRVWVAGVAEPSLELVADYADCWLVPWVKPARYPIGIANIHARLEARGRDVSAFTVGWSGHVTLAGTTDEARTLAAPTIRLLAEGYGGTTGGFAEDEDDLDPEDEVWNSSLIGSPRHVRRMLEEYVESGCTAFELKFNYHTIDHMLEQWKIFSTEVIPAFK